MADETKELAAELFAATFSTRRRLVLAQGDGVMVFLHAPDGSNYQIRMKVDGVLKVG